MNGAHVCLKSVLHMPRMYFSSTRAVCRPTATRTHAWFVAFGKISKKSLHHSYTRRSQEEVVGVRRIVDQRIIICLRRLLPPLPPKHDFLVDELMSRSILKGNRPFPISIPGNRRPIVFHDSVGGSPDQPISPFTVRCSSRVE